MNWDTIWPWLLLLGFFLAIVVPSAWGFWNDEQWCQESDHRWVDHGWFASCLECPAEVNYYDRPGGAG